MSLEEDPRERSPAEGPPEATPDEVRERVRAGGLIGRPSQPVLAMLSGGRDSVCLLDVAVSLCGAGDVQALHVNYGLRPEADADERHCAGLCERLGVALEVVRARAEGDPAPPGNLQAWARKLRYGAAMRLAEQRDARSGLGDAGPRGAVARETSGGSATVVATGHTATDQVETILYRLAASPGRRALLGMVPREGRLVRPLLALTREQTAAYCRARGLAWREDASNDSLHYARGRVRHGLVPALRAVHPAAEANVLRTARLLREEAELLDGLVEAELRAAAPGARSVSIERLASLPAALARLVVVRLAEDAAGALVPQAGARVGEILALARRGGRAELHVGGRVGAVVEDGELRMVRLPPRAP
jgi:tRNA(Ile)-lysidine synthase